MTKMFEKLFFLMPGLLMPTLILAQEPDRMGDGMMEGCMMPGMGIFMAVIWVFLIVLLVVAILALIKYFKEKVISWKSIYWRIGLNAITRLIHIRGSVHKSVSFP